MREAGSLRRRIEDRWYGETAAPLARPLALLYGGAVRLRRAAFRGGWLKSRHPGVPVVVIGNLTVGGTGKTPLAIWLAEQLSRAGRRPGIALRGYGGTNRAARLVGADADPGEAGDEAVLLARRTGCPVAAGARRADAAALLAARGCDLVIADDGLQHLALARDLAVVVIDGERGFGNGALLPAGPLREPASRLDDADVIVVRGEDRRGAARGRRALRMELVPGALRQLATGREAPLEVLRGETVHAVAGIGHPRRFFALLRELHAAPVEHAFADHHRYVARDLAFDDGLRVVMTEKDAVKCGGLATDRMWYLPVAAELPPEDAQRLLRAVQEARGGRARA